MNTQHGNGIGTRFGFTRSTTARWAAIAIASFMALLGASASAERMIPMEDAGASGGGGGSALLVSTDPFAVVATEDTEAEQTWVCPPCPTP